MSSKLQMPPQLVLKGPSREIGLAHGTHLQSQIKSQLSIYQSMFAHTSKLSWPEVRALAEQFRATAAQNIPDLYDEMQGIADGAGVDLLDIVALNCRSEISLGQASDGCTSLSWRKKDGARVLAQNWDWTTTVRDNLAIVQIEKAGMPVISMVTEAGIVGKIGFNSAGVGVCLNAIKAPVCDSSKLPIHVALRVCLESTSVDAALSRLSALGGAASSQHILIADSSTALGLELSPLREIHLVEDGNGLIIHTNHFLENQSVKEPPWLPSSPVRLARCQHLTSELLQEGVAGDQITSQLLRNRIFSDTADGPGSICGAEDPARHIARRTATLFNIVMNLEPGRLGAEVVMGRPGSGEESEVVRLPLRE